MERNAQQERERRETQAKRETEVDTDTEGAEPGAWGQTPRRGREQDPHQQRPGEPGGWAGGEGSELSWSWGVCNPQQLPLRCCLAFHFKTRPLTLGKLTNWNLPHPGPCVGRAFVSVSCRHQFHLAGAVMGSSGAAWMNCLPGRKGLWLLEGTRPKPGTPCLLVPESPASAGA